MFEEQLLLCRAYLPSYSLSPSPPLRFLVPSPRPRPRLRLAPSARVRPPASPTCSPVNRPSTYRRGPPLKAGLVAAMSTTVAIPQQPHPHAASDPLLHHQDESSSTDTETPTSSQESLPNVPGSNRFRRPKAKPTLAQQTSKPGVPGEQPPMSGFFPLSIKDAAYQWVCTHPSLLTAALPTRLT